MIRVGIVTAVGLGLSILSMQTVRETTPSRRLVPAEGMTTVIVGVDAICSVAGIAIETETGIVGKTISRSMG